jgi:hypothetical protein
MKLQINVRSTLPFQVTERMIILVGRLIVVNPGVNVLLEFFGLPYVTDGVVGHQNCQQFVGKCTIFTLVSRNDISEA